MTSSNVIAARHDIRVQRNASFSFFFQLVDADGNILGPNDVFRVRAQVRNIAGKVVTAFEMGDGMEWFEHTTGWVLVMSKSDSEKNISPGSYDWDLMVAVTEGNNQYPLRGPYVMVNNITE
ncbi:hypothetical protein [Chitinophaga pinensis]|uniref:Uncharacterized protein n=1 Tax=Chitinophaga pinensis (strain ATCC 43595 / DSM 2588 / LMG 13176 / NBRC 15968 / NCIMB 11800 / UQM 2034) TaxID=485918 RepID=A0A979G614_CHIPD|nr:hypothetical protein [Chitinophaga pinensis]ACU61375.1 hypothetical protein Cpin_3913 [Chitinophaga pinensis DSM 2588]